MSLKSGWCMDEVMYRDLDKEGYARRLHSNCKRLDCTCENHNEEPQ